MKTLMTDFNLLESEKTPDYSPHVPLAPLPLHIRERGRDFITFRKRDLAEMVSSFRASGDVFEKLVNARIVAPFSPNPDEQMAKSRGASDGIAPLVFRESNDEHEVEAVMVRFPVKEKVVRTSASRVIDKPMVFFDEEPLCEDSDDFPPLVKHRSSVRTIVKNATLSRFEPDEGASE